MQQNARSDNQPNQNYSQQHFKFAQTQQFSQQLNDRRFIQETFMQWEAQYIQGRYYLADQTSIQKLKKIQQQIEKQKLLIAQLQEQNMSDKSYLSIQDHLNQNKEEIFDNISEVNRSIFQNRKEKAQEQLLSEQHRYRQNIKKMQKKKAQIKKSLKMDQQIQISIKKQIKDQQRIQRNHKQLIKLEQERKSIIEKSQKNNQINTLKSSKKCTQEQHLVQNSIQKQSLKKVNSIQKHKITSSKKKYNQSIDKNQHKEGQNLLLQNQEGYIQAQTGHMSQNQLKQSIISQSKDSRNSRPKSISKKQYSVKVSSVKIPQINQSMIQIENRKKQQAQLGNSNVISIKMAFTSKSKNQVQQKNELESKSHNKTSIIDKSKFQKFLQEKSSKSKQVSSIHDKVEIIQQVRQKQVSQKSKKSSLKKVQDNVFMYVPHAPKQKSIGSKSFKKDKSIQWSQIDVSMYGQTNMDNHTSGLSNLQQSHISHLQSQRQVSNLGLSKLNMKKNKKQSIEQQQQKSNEQIKSDKQSKIQEASQKNKRIEKKSQKQISKISQKNGKSFIMQSREGSLKQKVDKFQQAGRDHSLKEKSKASYRSRKTSNKKQYLDYQQSKKSNKISENQRTQIKKQEYIVSKEQLMNLHNQIKMLQQKLQKVQFKQSELQKQREQVMLKRNSPIVPGLYQQNNQKTVAIEIIETEKQQIDLSNLKGNAQQQLQSNSKDQIQNSLKQSIQSQMGQNNQNNDFINVKQDQIQQEQVKKQWNAYESDPHLNSNQLKQLAQLQRKVEDQVKVQLIQQSQNPLLQEKNYLTQQPQQKKSIKAIQSYELQNQTFRERQSDIQQFIKSDLDIFKQKKLQLEAQQLDKQAQNYNNQKSKLNEQINRLKKIIRDLQMEKIKSIDHENHDLTHQEQKYKKQEAESELQNQVKGYIINQFNKSKEHTYQSISDLNLESKREDVGKIVKNSPQKYNQTKNQEAIKKNSSFRINLSKKNSSNQDINFGATFKSSQFSSKNQNKLEQHQSSDKLPLKKKNESYPLDDKNLKTFKIVSKQIAEQPKQLKKIFKKQEILQRFNQTNRQFNSFVQSSRIINETESNISRSQKSFINQSNPNVIKGLRAKNRQIKNQDEQISQNNQSSYFLNNASLSPLKHSFSRIVDQLKDQNPEQQQTDIIQDIQIGQIQIPQLPQTPTIQMSQQELINLAIQTYKTFGIEVDPEDYQFTMKKYKNCIIFNKAHDTILWHYVGKFYIGGWKNKQSGQGEKSGEGIQIIPQKHIYKGQFLNGKKNGTGILKSVNGNIYDGQWIDGLKNGQGTYFDLTTKVTYKGQWKDGKKNGYGFLKFSQKQYYHGTFVKSVKQGYGIQVFVNGDKYKGQYKKGKFHGRGKYIWSNGSSYQGQFKQGMRHGNGSWKSAKSNADIYVGSYLNDKKCGFGRYVWANGCVYEGNFADDVKHGKGKMIYADGKQIKGQWNGGSLIEEGDRNHEKDHEQPLRKSVKIFQLHKHRL